MVKRSKNDQLGARGQSCKSEVFKDQVGLISLFAIHYMEPIGRSIAIAPPGEFLCLTNISTRKKTVLLIKSRHHKFQSASLSDHYWSSSFSFILSFIDNNRKMPEDKVFRSLLPARGQIPIGSQVSLDQEKRRRVSLACGECRKKRIKVWTRCQLSKTRS